MTTYSIDRADFPCLAAVAERIRGLAADGYQVEVTEAGALLYRVEPMPTVRTGLVYLLYMGGGFSVGTYADADVLVRSAEAMTARSAE